MAGTKICTKCGGDDFNQWGNCRICLRRRVASYHSRNKEQIKQHRKKRQAETLEGKLYVWSSNASQRLRRPTKRRRAFLNGKRRITKAAGGTITAAQLRDLWYRQNGLCALTGWPMVIRTGAVSPRSVSVDRIDQTKRYDIDNLRLVTLQANCARLFGTDDDLYRFCEDVVATWRSR